MKHKLHVRRDENVVVLTGEESGKRGRVLSVDREKKRVIVEGINRRTRAIRRSQQNPRGGLEERECPLHISNVMSAEKYDARQTAPQEDKKNGTAEDTTGEE